MNKENTPQHIFLIGMPTSGKSYFGKRVANKINAPFVDLDDYIVSKTGISIEEQFEKGEQCFRNNETEALSQLCKELVLSTIVACGGGTPCSAANMQLLKKHGKIIYITMSVNSIFCRLEQSVTNRPLLKDVSIKRIEALLDKRKEWYEKADVQIIGESLNTNKLINTIQFLLK